MKSKKTLWINLFIFIPLFFLFHNCYLSKQGYHLLAHQYNAQQIDKVLKDPHLSESERNMLLSVKKIKHFGTKHLGLIENKNYTTYIKTSKNYLLDIVSASAKDRFVDYTWWYPFFGTFPYKGFYERSDAELAAKELKLYNLDVLIRKSDAYSTLGFFNDPLYSYMADYSPYSLSGLIFHEMTHATLYIPSQMQFNENLASFVEREGALLYLKETYGQDSKELKEAIASIKDSETFLKEMKKLSQKLQELYETNLSFDEKLKKREIIFESFKKDFIAQYDQNFSSNRYRYIEKIKINNAFIRLFLLYEEKLSLFYQYYETQGKDLKKMLESLQEIQKTNENPFEFMKKRIS